MLCDSQHGFCINHSTNTNLITFYHRIIKCIGDGYQADVIFTDFAKAFVSVNHYLLL